jgi:methyl-accepting chemotaxis protein
MLKFKRIGTKITVAIVMVGMIISLGIGSIVGLKVSKEFTSEALKLAEETVSKHTEMIDRSFNTTETAVQMLSQNLESNFNLSEALNDPEYMVNFKSNYVKTVGDVAQKLNYTKSVYIYFNSEVFKSAHDIWFKADENNNFARQKEFDLSYFDRDASNTEWFYTPIDTKKPVWSAPYNDATGQLVTSYAMPVVKNGSVIAVVGMDFNVSDVAEHLNSIKLYGSGYIYMMNEDYEFIVHPTEERGTSLESFDGGDEAVDEMAESRVGHAKITLSGEKKIAGFAKLKNGWTIASSIPAREVTRVVDQIMMLIGIIIAAGLVISMISAYIIGKSISKPIVIVTKALKKVENGDFTVRTEVRSQDETKVLADGLNDMANQMANLIGQTRIAGQDMADSATNLASMSEETSATSDEVSRTVEEIASGATSQAQDAEEATLQANYLAELFETLIDSSKKMEEKAQVASAKTKEGNESVDVLEEKAKASREANERVGSAVKSLDERSQSISTIVDTITSIAEQTNLLALNASIEAARAGEAGRGFAVVADEIRKLAEESSNAANEIYSIIEGIQREFKETVNIMEEMETISADQNQAVDSVGEVIYQVLESVKHITEEIKVVSDQIVQVDQVKTGIISSIENISAVSQETAAATEEVTASMEQQNMAVEEVAKSAEQLNHLSMDLMNLMSKFRI